MLGFQGLAEKGIRKEIDPDGAVEGGKGEEMSKVTEGKRMTKLNVTLQQSHVSPGAHPLGQQPGNHWSPDKEPFQWMME